MSSDEDNCGNSKTQDNNINTEDIQSMDKSVVDTISNLVGNISLADQKQPGNNKNDPILEEKNILKIPPWLEDCETPFSWHLEQERDVGSELVIFRTLEKLDDLLIEEPGFSCQRFISLLKLVLEYYIVGDIDKCYENMKIIDGCLEEEISRNEPCYTKMRMSLGHVVSSTKAHVLYILGKEEESKKIGKCIIPIKVMTDIDKAALNSMKARFFLNSGYENGEAVGVTYAQRALELEPDNPEYEYLLAKLLRQQRKDKLFSTEVPRDELKLLESAVKRGENPKYRVYLAQAYSECASQALKQYRNHPNFHSELKSSIDLMSERSLQYYKEALSLGPDNPALLRRVGYGIMNLNKKYADYDLALECLLKSLEISENLITLHILGTFYLRYGNDKKKALEYFEKTAKAGSHAGLSDMVRVKWILNPNDYDPCPDLEIGLTWKLKKKDHNNILVQLGGYHFFIKRDFCKAIEYFKQIILQDKDAPQMTSFKSFFLKMYEPINLKKYLANEALLLVQKHDSTGSAEPERSNDDEAKAQPVNQGYAEDFLDLISEVYPELLEITPDKDLVPKLINASKEIENSWNQNNTRRNNSRGRWNSNYSGFRGRGNNYRGGYRGGRQENQDDNERRGRFSVQREGSGGERRGRFNRGRGPRQNWQPRPRNDDGREDGDKRDQENWRKK